MSALRVDRMFTSFGAIPTVVIVNSDAEDTQPIGPLDDLIDVTHYELPPASAEVPAWFTQEFTARLATYTPGDDLTALVRELWQMVG